MTCSPLGCFRLFFRFNSILLPNSFALFIRKIYAVIYLLPFMRAKKVWLMKFDSWYKSISKQFIFVHVVSFFHLFSNQIRDFCNLVHHFKLTHRRGPHWVFFSRSWPCHWKFQLEQVEQNERMLSTFDIPFSKNVNRFSDNYVKCALQAIVCLNYRNLYNINESPKVNEQSAQLLFSS